MTDDQPLRAKSIDAILHDQRLVSGNAPQPVSAAELSRLPDGAMVVSDGNFFALRTKRWFPWSFEGYGEPVETASSRHETVFLVTPELTCRALRRGYDPVWHHTVGP